MSVYTLKPLTESSYILFEDGNRVSVVIDKAGSLMLLGGNIKKKKFSGIDDLSDFLGSKVTVEATDDDEVEELNDLNGFPIKHNSAVAVEHSVLPLYKKSATSNTIYSAGYYGIKFNHGWVTSYCPKSSTVIENEYVGPFKTKLEMLNAISQKKKEIVI